MTRQETPRATGRFGQRLTVAEWSRGPGADREWRLGEPDWGLVIDEDGQARCQAGAAIATPGPVVAAACTRSGVACLVTEAGQLALWQFAGDADQPGKLGEPDFGVLIACVAICDTAHPVMAACIDDTDGTTIRVLDGSSLAEVAALPFDGFVRDADVSTGRSAAALGHDCRLRVWDVVTRDVLCESVRGLGVSRIAFDQDYVMAGEAGTGAVGRFPVDLDRLKERARQAANRRPAG